MKTSPAVVLALLATSTLAYPIAITPDRHVNPRDVATSVDQLEPRRIMTKVLKYGLKAGFKVGKWMLPRSTMADDLGLEAREDFSDYEDDLFARDAPVEQRRSGGGSLLRRELEYLEARRAKKRKKNQANSSNNPSSKPTPPSSPPKSTPLNSQTHESTPPHSQPHESTPPHSQTHESTPPHSQTHESTPPHSQTHESAPIHSQTHESTPPHSQSPKSPPPHSQPPEGTSSNNKPQQANSKKSKFFNQLSATAGRFLSSARKHTTNVFGGFANGLTKATENHNSMEGGMYGGMGHGMMGGMGMEMGGMGMGMHGGF